MRHVIIAVVCFIQLNEETMDITSLIIFLAIGALAGWLAGLIMEGGDSGLVINIILGVVGAVIGGMLFDLFDIRVAGILGSLFMATIGAMLLLFAVGFFRKARSQ